VCDVGWTGTRCNVSTENTSTISNGSEGTDNLVRPTVLLTS
jgi:hypothetical protein